MNENNPYSSVISLRSRRLRTLGVTLLVVLALLTGFGLLKLMPAAKTAAMLHRAEIQKAEAQRATAPAASMRTLRRVHRLMAIKLILVNAYWLLCGLIAFAAMVVAWLDFREVARQYADERHLLWNEAAKIPSADELRIKP